MASPETMPDEVGKKKCMTCLPHEMIELVLVRLPVSTLLRCRSVCKLWDHIIRDPQFIEAHLKLASPCSLIFSHRESCSNKLYPSEAILFDEALSPSRWNAPLVEPDDFLCASCNGLVLLYSEKSTIKIANLATGECLHVAKPSKKLKGDSYSFYNFGYHPVTKQYKVIHFLGDNQVLAGSTSVTFIASVIQVYTLGNDNWRDVRAPEDQCLDYVQYSGVVNVDGAMHWLNENKESSWECAVVSFDLNEEGFKLTHLPEADLTFKLDCYGMFTITEVDGKLCFVARGVEGKVRIWTLDSKVDQSWSQKYIIHLSSLHIFIPGPCSLHGDKILLHDRDRNFYYHELMGQNVEIDPRNMVKLLNYSPHRFLNVRSYMYVKSLVRLDAYNRARIVLRPKRQDGWELKKWERWMQDLCSLEKLWKTAYMSARSISEQAHAMGMDVSLQLDYPPEKHRLNWVEQKRAKEMLKASSKKIHGILQAMVQAGSVSRSKKNIDKAGQGECSSAAGNSDP